MRKTVQKLIKSIRNLHMYQIPDNSSARLFRKIGDLGWLLITVFSLIIYACIDHLSIPVDYQFLVQLGLGFLAFGWLLVAAKLLMNHLWHKEVRKHLIERSNKSQK